MVPTTFSNVMFWSLKREELQSPATPLKVVHWVIAKGVPRRPLSVKSVRVTLLMTRKKILDCFLSCYLR